MQARKAALFLVSRGRRGGRELRDLLPASSTMLMCLSIQQTCVSVHGCSLSVDVARDPAGEGGAPDPKATPELLQKQSPRETRPLTRVIQSVGQVKVTLTCGGDSG